MTAQEVSKKWQMYRDDRRVETVSFKASEHQLNRIDDLLKKYPGVTKSTMLYDLVGLGLAQYELMNKEY
jgi:hypothetical protein